ncbi:Gamma-aminobutyric acid (GABA) B receptor [Seminavis robusta]|uniref:Gamma-aminobutyric acid (GABA) B receptor n=1 Tax=Seminavis robusta TaxID=568900 RepID=A0A9N8F0Y9_9STRA|nr:Gamma-aminobutyric acid (GABA) B receptor [Seminavis robusta]|eukprot:Sro3814_g351260.1 Gamma-aminobutyric acid (GABA) B receptor (253) ;mRNA; f:3427-4185
MSALFSKLMRVNEIFHAQGFQRKVVTVKDVLRPFAILFTLNVTLLATVSAVDPLVWVYHDDKISGCYPATSLGYVLYVLLGLLNLIALFILCVQAYRARDIDSEFSEARGVAFALCTWFVSFLIVIPTEQFLGFKDCSDALHMLRVMYIFVVSSGTLLFIFAPIIAHHRQRQQQRASTTHSRTRISGIDTQHQAPSIGIFLDEERANGAQTDYAQRVAEMELELKVLRSRLIETEDMQSAEESGKRESSHSD